MKRREFLGTAAFAACAQSSARPNVLWLSIEDASPMLGCYGDPHAITPNVDNLAREGVRYAHAYSVAGVCAPSRSGIITGMYPTSMGSMHMRCEAKLPASVKCFPEYLREAGYYCTNNAKTDYNFAVPKKAWDAVGRSAHWKNRTAGQPFFAVFNQEITHESRYLRRGKALEESRKGLKPSEYQDPGKLKTIPPYYPDTQEVRRDWANVYEGLTLMDYWLAERLKEIADAGLENDTIVFFWGDHGVGLPRAKRWLYESGTRVPLIVRVPAKYRQAGQGAPNSVDQRLVSLIDLGPTVLNLAGVRVPEHMHGQAFLGANLPPARKYIYGIRDRMDERYDIIRSVRSDRYRYIRNYEPAKTYFQYMNTAEKGGTMQEIRRVHAEGKAPAAAAQFLTARKPVEELYDVSADPHEIRNLAGDPKYKQTLEGLRKAHMEWVVETRDLGLVPEQELVEREKVTGHRYGILRGPQGLETMKRIRTAATSEDRAVLQKMAQDSEPAVRYWVARKVASPAMLGDVSASVRVAAAQTILMKGSDGAALAVLKQELKSREEWIRLLAAIALDECGDKARGLVPDLKAALEDENKYVVRVVNRALNRLLGTSNEVA